jgi:alpha-glucosidase
LDHIYTLDQPETVDMVYQWRQVMDDYQKEHGGDTRIIMTETYSPLEIVKQYYGNATHKGAHMPFNFQLLMNIKSSSTAENFKEIIDKWMAIVPSNTSSNWVVRYKHS